MKDPFYISDTFLHHFVNDKGASSLVMTTVYYTVVMTVSCLFVSRVRLMMLCLSPEDCTYSPHNGNRRFCVSPRTFVLINNFFQSCQRRDSNRCPLDKKASALSTPPRGTHVLFHFMYPIKMIGHKE